MGFKRDGDELLIQYRAGERAVSRGLAEQAGAFYLSVSAGGIGRSAGAADQRAA